VTDATTAVFLEAAHFAPAAIMGRGRKLGLHTDAWTTASWWSPMLTVRSAWPA
ncbi:hypothetical protein C7E17_24815, partial [Stenotrophomonas maltophilia]